MRNCYIIDCDHFTMLSDCCIFHYNCYILYDDNLIYIRDSYI